MQKLLDKLSTIRNSKEIGLMTHWVAGYPSIEESESIALAMTQAGSDILEIQIPFSDPIADGPIIAKANADSLANGTNVKRSLEMIGRLSASSSAPVIIMTYYNIVFANGVESFCKSASKCGCQGLIIPDFPFDEERGNGLIEACKSWNLAFIPVIAPNTRSGRLKAILEKGTGFAYCTARAGTTGDKTVIDTQTLEYLGSVEKNTSLPIGVGFGINSRSHMLALKKQADFGIVGSALIRMIQEKGASKGKEAILDLIRLLKAC